MRPQEVKTRFVTRSKYHTAQPPKCKHCSRDVKRNTTPDGRNKGYYRTCGNPECLTAQYRDTGVNAQKRCKPYPKTCEGCHQAYEACGHTQRWCYICVPNKEARSRMQRYGISEPQYQDMLREQNNVCAICRLKFPRCVDHSHITGIVRKLLCDGCNTRLSGIDDRRWLERALEYVSISFASASGLPA
jgi:hypothetical protein